MQSWLFAQSQFGIFAGICLAAFAAQFLWLRNKEERRTPWLIWLLAGALLVCSWCLADDAEFRERHNIQSITQGFANLYAREMEKRGHWKLKDDVAKDDPLYLSLIQTEIDWLSLNSVVNDIYTLRKRPDGKRFIIVDSETDYNHNGKYDEEREQRTDVGEVYDVVDVGMDRAFQGIANFDFQPVTDRWGTWVSAFVPLHDPEGRFDGVLGVDFDAKEFATKLSDAKLRVFGLMALLEAMLLGSSTFNLLLRAQIKERRRTDDQVRSLSRAVEQSPASIVITDCAGNIEYVNLKFTQVSGYSLDEVRGKNPRVLKSGETPASVYQQMWKTISQSGEWHGEFHNKKKSGELHWEAATVSSISDASGQITHFLAVKEDITERKKIEETLQRQQTELRILFDLIPAMIFFKDTENNILRVNQRVADAEGKTIAEIEGKPVTEVYPENAERLYSDDLEVIRSKAPKLGMIETMQAPNGETRWIQKDKVPYCDKDGKVVGIVVMAQDVTERKAAEAELKTMHKQLLDTSRQAGMAEVATSVLHNVGNVLNSVNVSATLVAEGIRKSKVSYVGKVASLLDEHAADLGSFMTTHPKGKHLAPYIRQLSDCLATEQAEAIAELEALRKNIDHIRDIVAMQQSYAKVSGVTETVKVTDLVEDSLRMHGGALARHEVEIIREYRAAPLITVEKHKVLQLLVNLIRNAKYACDDSGRKDKRMTIRVANGEGRIKISVIDNGIGIQPENLTRIFNHGFTTRKEGHGFGLHSGALAARELGGSLTAHSDGPGRGANFTLELPV